MNRLGRRFTRHFEPRPDKVRPLNEDNEAVVEGRTIFPNTVVDAPDSPAILVSGKHQRKIGEEIVRGPWKGLPIYTLTLEERRTCPRSCHNWRACYGNAMPYARRHRAGPEFESELEAELRVLNRRHRRHGGFAVRLHILGDFYNFGYAMRWREWMARIDGLHVWGYTAWPATSRIGSVVTALNDAYPDRFLVRFSVPEPTGGAYEATTVWSEERRVAGAIVCPVQTRQTAACGTCGLCWHPRVTAPIAFIGHGAKFIGRRGLTQEDPPAVETRTYTVGRPRLVIKTIYHCGCEFIGLKAETPAACYRHGQRQRSALQIGTERDPAAMALRTLVKAGMKAA